MGQWFECKIQYEKEKEKEVRVKVTEPYLVDALNFTEAESRVTQEMQLYGHGEFTVADIKRVNYRELFNMEDNSSDKWYKCKLAFITLDEKTQAEKRSTFFVLVKAGNLRQAVEVLTKQMDKGMADYQILSVAETAIVDVYPYQAQ